jgi:hypothetical protein
LVATYIFNQLNPEKISKVYYPAPSFFDNCAVGKKNLLFVNFYIEADNVQMGGVTDTS